MAQITETSTEESLDELKIRLKKLNSKAGQMKMDLHDLAEGLPINYQQLMKVAGQTYQIFQQMDELKKQIAKLERGQ